MDDLTDSVSRKMDLKALLYRLLGRGEEKGRLMGGNAINKTFVRKAGIKNIWHPASSIAEVIAFSQQMV